MMESEKLWSFYTLQLPLEKQTNKRPMGMKTVSQKTYIYVIAETTGNNVWGCLKETNPSTIDQPDQKNHFQALVDLVSDNLH